jgi:hypothetical protein
LAGLNLFYTPDLSSSKPPLLLERVKYSAAAETSAAVVCSQVGHPWYACLLLQSAPESAPEGLTMSLDSVQYFPIREVQLPIRCLCSSVLEGHSQR